MTGMTFHYTESACNVKSFPLCFLNTEDMVSTTDEHQAVISSVIANNDKLSHDTVIMARTSGNHSATTLGVEQYLDYSVAMRCICHSISLTVNYASSECRYFPNLRNKINEITEYGNSPTKISTKIAEKQCRNFTRYRIVRLKRDCSTP